MELSFSPCACGVGSFKPHGKVPLPAYEVRCLILEAQVGTSIFKARNRKDVQ